MNPTNNKEENRMNLDMFKGVGITEEEKRFSKNRNFGQSKKGERKVRRINLTFITTFLSFLTWYF